MKDSAVKYLKAKIKSVSKLSKERYNNIVKATDVAKESSDRRLDGMNEFRASLKDQNATFVPRSEYKVQTDKLDHDIQDLKEFKAMHEGKATMGSVYIAYILAALGVIVSVILHFL
jgi:hypothetical protein